MFPREKFPDSDKNLKNMKGSYSDLFYLFSNAKNYHQNLATVPLRKGIETLFSNLSFKQGFWTKFNLFK
jgi:hypothetical protein